LLGVLALFFGGSEGALKGGTSYDASGKGFRAVYLLLEELGFPVTRSKRLAGGEVRWVLFPETTPEKADLLKPWVQGGGLLVLADSSATFASHLGMEVKVHELDEDPGEQSATGAGVGRLAGGKKVVEWPGHKGQVWARVNGQPAVTIYQRGLGQVWLVNRPELVTNRLLPKADNALLVCRMAEENLSGRSGKIEFDEYFHGMRERPGVMELLFQPPTLWVTLQGIVIGALLLWHFMPRFGNLRSPRATRRLSQQEFLDALASLLERRGDYAEARATVRADLRHAIARELGLPAGTPVEEVVNEAARRRPAVAEALRQSLLGRTAPPGKAGFIKALNAMETTRDEFFRGRENR
jgi:hypothetical protein